MTSTGTAKAMTDGAEPSEPDGPFPTTFRHLLANTLLTGVTSSFLWFALTFWVFLETRSVVATGVIGGAFSLSSAVLGPLFGAIVDRHRKKVALVVATSTSAVAYSVAAAVFVAVSRDDLLRLAGPWFWVLTGTTLVGAVAGQMRAIALSTCVTLLVPERQRDRANGAVGSITGVSFAITSVVSGLVVGGLGMGWAYGGTVAATVVALAHLVTIDLGERDRTPLTGDGGHSPLFDIAGAMEAINAVPGLRLLLALAAFNNLVAGVFIALMDAYGLSLVSVETWGLLWGFISLAFIAGGLVVARFGLGAHPLRVLVVGNLVNWSVCSVFTLRSSIALLTVGMVVWLTLMPVIEAAEQTLLQRSVPYERQGRVFGFAQLVENAAAPLTAFLMAPLAEAVFIPYMTTGGGVDAIGSWFGTGFERGIALMFTLAGLLGVVVTLLAWNSPSYRALDRFSTSRAPADRRPGEGDGGAAPAAG